ncbi:MAG: PqqD family protein [Flavobacteriales bacterium]
MKLKKNIAVSDSGFIFNPATGDSYSINPIGSMIVKMMKEDKSDEQIVKSLLDHFMTDRATVEKDLYDFKNMLSSLKLAE